MVPWHHSDRLQNKGYLFYYGYSLFSTIDFPLEIPGDRRKGKLREKWVFKLMRNAQSE